MSSTRRTASSTGIRASPRSSSRAAGPTTFPWMSRPGASGCPKDPRSTFTIATAMTEGIAETMGFRISESAGGPHHRDLPPDRRRGHGWANQDNRQPEHNSPTLRTGQAWFLRVVGSSPSAVHVSTSVPIQGDRLQAHGDGLPHSIRLQPPIRSCFGYISCRAATARRPRLRRRRHAQRLQRRGWNRRSSRRERQ